ncbi:MAG TPA: putative PEP-binding protein, partial [Pyrinomonadaceae bacterium]|nr:putative PEP-binding protein [Pyrinomonadaceae bacterium]
MKPRESVSNRPEVRLVARAVSRGVAFGTVVCLYGRSRQFYRRPIPESQIAFELDRFHAAVDVSREQLVPLASRSPAGSATLIFNSHLLILNDPALGAKIEETIEHDKVNAEWAVKKLTDAYIAEYKALPDDNLREKYIDLEDVSERLLNALGGATNESIRLPANAIIVCGELKPSTLVELAESKPVGIITESGGWTSHTFIIARELNLPAVTGIKKLERTIRDGDEVIVDGYTGHVILHPAADTINRYSGPLHFSNESGLDLGAVDLKPLQTLDGRKIILRANADSPAIYERAKQLGAEGVGLYRSEYVYNLFKGYPSESQQAEAYGQIADAAGDAGVKIRTFDLDNDGVSNDPHIREKNPALGLRSVRLSLARPEQLRTQIRALLIASNDHRLDIVVPMVSGVAEMTAVA